MSVIVGSDGGNISNLFSLKKQSGGTAITRLRKNKQVYFRENRLAYFISYIQSFRFVTLQATTIVNIVLFRDSKQLFLFLSLQYLLTSSNCLHLDNWQL